MARKRMIDPKFWTDDKIIELEPLCRLLFIGIWNFADDSGVHLNNSKVLKAEIFPADDISVAEVDTMKTRLLELGMIEISSNENLFRITNWEIYQKINRPQPSKYKFSESSVISNELFIGKVREYKEIEDNIIKDNKEDMEQKVRKPKPSAPKLKPYKERVEDFFDNIDGDFKNLMQESYPNVDIDKELLKAKTWLLVNTHKAKKQFKRFVNNWLSSAMENAGRYNSQSSQDHMLKIKEEKIERDRLMRIKEMREQEKDAATPEEIKAALSGYIKGGKDVKTNKD